MLKQANQHNVDASTWESLSIDVRVRQSERPASGTFAGGVVPLLEITNLVNPTTESVVHIKGTILKPIAIIDVDGEQGFPTIILVAVLPPMSSLANLPGTPDWYDGSKKERPVSKSPTASSDGAAVA
jgi:hypothetical protein